MCVISHMGGQHRVNLKQRARALTPYRPLLWAHSRFRMQRNMRTFVAPQPEIADNDSLGDRCRQDHNTYTVYNRL